MKNILRKSNFGFTKWCVALIAAGWMGGGTGFTQTAPTAQSLPFNVNFGTTTFTTLPAGVAVWNGLSGGSVSTQTLAEGSAPTANATLAIATASTTSGGAFGYSAASDGKLYIQTSSNASNGVNQPVIAIVTTGGSGITLAYTIDVINASSRTVGVVAQYRVGTSGGWTTLVPTSGLNPFSQAGGTAGLKTTASVTLPSAADNQPVVQIRWAVWRGTETGNSSGLALDNISVTTAPTVAPAAPVVASASAISTSGFTANWAASSGATKYFLDVATDSGFTSFVTGYQNKDVENVTSSAVTSLNAGTTYYYRVRANNSAGTSASSEAQTALTTAAGTPSVTVSPTSATGLTNYVGQVSASTNYTVTGTNLGGTNVVVTASTNAIEVSTNSSTGFTNSFSLAPSVDGTLTNVVYVRMSALAPAGAVSATVSNVSGTASNNFTVSGTVTQPALTLVLATNRVAENAGANATTGTVGIPASLGTDLVVNLVSTNTAAATVPASVTITNGQTSATFPIDAVANSSSYGPATTSIEASNSNYTTASATLTVTNVDVPPAPLAAKGWINEFHYDNSTANDPGEFVEIVLAPGTSDNVSVVFYNGGTSTAAVPYSVVVTLPGGTSSASILEVPFASMTLGTASNGYRILTIPMAASTSGGYIQNGGNDGMALIIDGVVEEFLSYEGVMTASTGAAAGYTSTDCKVSETQATPNTSIQRVGPGSRAADFAWIAGAASSKGSANTSQNLGATAVQGTGTLAIANATPSSPYVTQNIFPKATAGQTVSLTLTGTLSSGTISSMSVVVPAAFTGLTAGNVTVSGTGAGTPVKTLSGSTLTITGLVVDQLNPVTINIAGLTTPETAGDLTKDGNYPFTVQTGVDGNLQSLLIQPIAVVTIPIANLGDVDANGVSLDVGKTVAVQGVCTEENFNSTSSTSAYLQSGQPNGILKAGINIYSGQRNLFVRGDEYVVTGSVLNYSGLTELVVAASSQVVRLGTATAVPTPETLTIAQLTAAHEAYEGSLVRVTGLSKVSGTWALTVVGTVTSGSNVTLANGGVDLTARLNVGSTALTEPTYPAAITGVYGQFVAASPFTGGGQIQPRDQADIEDAPGLRLALGDTLINEGGSFTSTTLAISRTGGSVGSVSGVLSAGTLGKVQVLEGGIAQQLPYSFTLADGVASTTLTIEAIDNSVYFGDVNVVLTATDSANSNPLSPGTATLTILENETAPAPDTTPPVITLIGANPLLLANGATYTDPGATVTDVVDGTRTIMGTGTVNTAVAGDYTITYNASDAAGNAAIPVTRTVQVAAPVVVESTYAEWSGGATLDSAGLAKYAIGGASSLTANDGVKPTTALTGGFLVITAIVRTDNSSLTVVGQAVTDLANYASNTSVTVVQGVEVADQNGVPTGHKRKTFSVAQGSDAKKFMRLSASLALSGVNTTVSVARDSGGASFLQVTGATAGATSGGMATSDKRSIYYYASDSTSSPTFSGGFWPYVIVQGQLSAGVGVTATLTKNGSGMLLVNGLPAYQYGGDSGSTTANGVSSAWPAMRADGSKTTSGPSGTLQ